MGAATEAAAAEAAAGSSATVVVPSALAGFAGGRSHISVRLGDAGAETGGGVSEPAGSGGGGAASGVAGDEAAQERPRSPLSAVLDELRRQAPALERRIRDERGAVRGHVNIYLDGVDIRELAGVGTVVVPGATVHIIAAVSGG